MARQNLNRAVRKIVLPSGRSIEVVCYEESTGAAERELHICPVCSGEFVQPYDWSATQDGNWHLTLECPNCAWTEAGTYGPVELQRLGRHLEAGVKRISDDLRRLTQANMATEGERLATALARDLILPEDF